MIFRLRNPIQRYAWGSVERLPRFLGVEPDGTPQAELWIGAHPSAPSLALYGADEVPLPQLIAFDPGRMLGAAVLTRFGAQLPFLFKVLAAAEPLSLQVHPDAEQARAGFAREEAAGLAPGDPRRTYRDPNHKPELLCALDGFDVLSGFRPVDEIVAVFEAFGLHPGWVDLARYGDAARLCAALWDLPPADRAALAASLGAAAAPSGPLDQRLPREAALVRLVTARYPGDIGVLVALCLNRLQLDAGEAMFAPAGLLHAYLGGFGLELMANSDNVVRAGLTTKAVDIDELSRLVVPGCGSSGPMAATADALTGELRFPVTADEFVLSSFVLTGSPVAVQSPGPEILICVDGGVDVIAEDGSRVALDRGGSAFVAAAAARYWLDGVGELYRAGVGLFARGRG